MKVFKITSLFIIFIFLFQEGYAQNNSAQNATKKTVNAKKRKPKKSVGLDYNSWFETLKFKTSSGSAEMKSLYYGLGINYDYTNYEPSWGYGFLIGVAQGYGIAGQSSQSTTSYYEKRVPWTALRAGGRLFTRVNTRIDIGFGLLFQYRQISWRSENGYDPVSPTNPLSGFFIETRWRLNYPIELVQSFGQYTKDTSMVWRIGGNYTLN